MRITIAAIAVTLVACAANGSPPEPPGIERQILSKDERRDLECARKLQQALAAKDAELGAEYQDALATAILAHAGKPGPVDYGPVCERLKDIK